MEPPPRVLPAGVVGHDAELLNAAVDRLEALHVVKPPAKFDEKYNQRKGRIIVNLWCGFDAYEGQPAKRPAQRQALQ